MSEDDARGFRRPESVLVVIHTPDLQVLLLRRVSPPDFWQSVTGSLLWDEAPADGALREVHEETGLGCRAADLVETGEVCDFEVRGPWGARFAPDVRFNREHRFYLLVPAPFDVRLSPGEHDAAEWLPVSDAAARAASWTNRDAITSLRRRHSLD